MPALEKPGKGEGQELYASLPRAQSGRLISEMDRRRGNDSGVTTDGAW